MKNLILSTFIFLFSVALAAAQTKGISKPNAVNTVKPAQPKMTKVDLSRPTKTAPVKPRVEAPLKTNSKPAKNMSEVREAAKVGIKRHQEIQSKLGTSKKGRISERARMTDIKTRKQMRLDIYSKNGRAFEIKPNTISGRKKGKSQLRKYENATVKRGGLIFYEPKTGKYRIERTPYKEWRYRQKGEPRPTERPRERSRVVRRRAVY